MGSGCVVTNVITVGNGGNDNYMLIDGGGAVMNSIDCRMYSYVTGTNNHVVVTGTGSLWSTSAKIMLGAAANSCGSYIIVTNGGVLNCAGGLWVGQSRQRGGAGG